MRRACAALAAVVALAGCGGLPDRTEVGRGLEIGGAPAAQWIDRRFDPPTPGMTTGEVVRNFVLESFASADNYSSSRNYLTTAAAGRWRPDLSTTVFSAGESMRVDQISPTVVEVSAPEVGRLDRHGRWVESAPGRRVSARFTMAQELGEWRISAFPPAFSTWMTDTDFRRGFVPLPVVYGVNNGVGSVVDYRWFPIGPRLATAVTRALLGPVPEHLRGMARTGFPVLTVLAVAAVPLDGGTATVDVTNHLLSASPTDRALALAQARATLMGVPGVQDVVVTAGGHRVEVPDSEREAAAQALGAGKVEAQLQVLARRGRVVGVDFGEGGDDIPRQGSPVQPAAWMTLPPTAEAVAIDAPMTGAAWVEGSVVTRQIRDARTVWRVPGTALTRPTFDVEGNVWVAGRSTSGKAAVWRLEQPRPGTSAVVQVVAPWLEGGAITSLRMTWDGRRAVMGWTSRAGVTTVGLASWSRSGPHGQVSLTQPAQLSAPSGAIVEVRVVGADSFAVVWRRGTDLVTSVSVVEASGAIATQPALPGVRVATQVRYGRLMALAGDRVFRLGTGWTEVGTATDVLVPGD